MIRASLMTDKGPVGIIGITEENVLRMRAGMPLDINIKELTPPNTRVNRMLIHLAPTHEEVVNDMVEAGMPLDDGLIQQARDLDEQLKRERLGRGRKQTGAR